MAYCENLKECYLNLAFLSFFQGNLEEAKAHVNHARKILENSKFGPTHPHIVECNFVQWKLEKLAGENVMKSYKRTPSAGWEDIKVSDISGQIHYSLLEKESEFTGITLNGFISEDAFEIIFQNVRNVDAFEKILKDLGYKIDPMEKLLGCCLIKIARSNVQKVLSIIAKLGFISDGLVTDIYTSINETQESLQAIRTTLKEKEASDAKKALELKAAQEVHELLKSKLFLVAHSLLKNPNNVTVVTTLPKDEKAMLSFVFSKLLRGAVPLGGSIRATVSTRDYYIASLKKYKDMEQLLISLEVPVASFRAQIERCEKELSLDVITQSNKNSDNKASSNFSGAFFQHHLAKEELKSTVTSKEESKSTITSGATHLTHPNSSFMANMTKESVGKPTAEEKLTALLGKPCSLMHLYLDNYVFQFSSEQSYETLQKDAALLASKGITVTTKAPFSLCNNFLTSASLEFKGLLSDIVTKLSSISSIAPSSTVKFLNL